MLLKTNYSAKTKSIILYALIMQLIFAKTITTSNVAQKLSALRHG